MLITGCSATNNVSFVTQPCLKPYDKFDFELGSDFVVMVNERIFIVPKDFITDLASVPRVMWSLYPPNDSRTIRASIIHDYLYSGVAKITRREADTILFDALISQGVSKYTAFKYWAAVRLFGRSHFKQNKNKD